MYRYAKNAYVSQLDPSGLQFGFNFNQRPKGGGFGFGGGPTYGGGNLGSTNAQPSYGFPKRLHGQPGLFPAGSMPPGFMPPLFKPQDRPEVVGSPHVNPLKAKYLLGKGNELSLNDFLNVSGAGNLDGAAIFCKAGCVGVTSMCLLPPKDWAGNNPACPQDHPATVGPWLKLADAMKLNGVKGAGKYVLFALIGSWKKDFTKAMVAKRTDPKTGMLKHPNDFDFQDPSPDINIVKKTPGMIWDFAAYQPSNKLWVGANHGIGFANKYDKPQKFFTRTTEQLQKGFKDPWNRKDAKGKFIRYTAIVYYAFKVN